MAPRVRAAASACLVASGLLISGVGGAMALADGGSGEDQGPSEIRKDSDDNGGEESIGDIVRRALGLGGNDGQVLNPWRRPDTRWGNGRGEGESTNTKQATDTKVIDTSNPGETSKPPETTKTTPRTTEPSKPPGEEPPGGFPEAGGGGSDGGAVIPLPRYKPPQVPDMQLPAELQPPAPGPGVPPVLDAGAGVVAAPPAVGPAVPIAVPVIVAPPIGLGVGGGGPGAAAGLPPAAPRGLPAQPPAGRNAPPAQAGSNAAAPNASYRIGYTEYLRTAGLPQVAALAVPGIVGILVLTGAGGLVGYRQAKAGHAVHVGGSARFMR